MIVDMSQTDQHMNFDESQFRHAMSQFATGVVVVAANESGALVGFAAQSFVSLSLDPPLVLFCPQKSSTSWPRIRTLRTFCINVLSDHHSELSDTFAVAGKVPNVAWSSEPQSSVARLDEAMTTIDCELDAEYEAGDHTIVVARVTNLHVHEPDAGPLLFFRGQYGHFEPQNVGS